MFCLKIKNLFSKNASLCYIPKEETQQNLFLSKYPKFDGKGIKIAIIDSGGDVSLEGLQKTSEGHPKIIDCFDFTGVGNVDTSVIKEMDSKNIILGLSGRKLKIPKKWINPSGKWHLGLKSLYKPTMSSSMTPEKLPEFDCIVWFDGKKWMACIETLKRDLEKAKVLTNFRDNHEYGILYYSNNLKMPYCITVHEDGNLLEIYSAYDHHGSIVAQVAAAHFPENPEKDGLAPGAQIIFMSVLDPSKELKINMKALKKAILKCIEMKVDIINYSIAFFAGGEEIENLIYEMIKKYNILLFKSAGNCGPFYGTVWRGDREVDSVTFTIGEIFTPKVVKRLYNIRITEVNSNEVINNSSARGPGTKGSRGLDFVAPGTIKITNKNPKFFSKNFSVAYTGTSLSSPNAAGAVACLISALKENSIEYSPTSIKFALFKTANLPKNGKQFEFGHGIIQIDAAFDYCKKNTTIPTFLTKSKGILFVQNDENQSDMERSVNLSDFIHFTATEDEDVAKKWTLELSSKMEECFKLSKIDKITNLFTVKIDTNKLESGSLKYAEIMVMDPLIGSLLNIPVFVIYLLKITETKNYSFQRESYLNYEDPYHLLFHPVFKNTFKKCEIKITALEKMVNTKVCVQYLVLDENMMDSAKTQSTQKILTFTPKNQIHTYFIPIKKPVIHDFCIYQNNLFSSTRPKFKLEISFKDDFQNGSNTVESEEEDIVKNAL